MRFHPLYLKFCSCAIALAGPAFGQVYTDFDFDGWDELVIGVPNDGSFTVAMIIFPGPGAVNLVYGGDHGLTVAGNALLTQGTLGEFDENSDQFGTSMAAGDFDGKGPLDLAPGPLSQPCSSSHESGVTAAARWTSSPSHLIKGRFSSRAVAAYSASAPQRSRRTPISSAIAGQGSSTGCGVSVAGSLVGMGDRRQPLSGATLAATRRARAAATRLPCCAAFS